MSTDAAGSYCPRCRGHLTPVAAGSPWCGQCWWNLDAYDADRAWRAFGWTWVDRATFRLAFRLNHEQFHRLSGHSVGRAPIGPPHIILTVTSVIVMIAILAAFVVGGWLVVRDFPNMSILPGLVLIGLGVVSLPKLARPPADPTLPRADAPTLFRLIDEVARAVGTRAPLQVVLDTSFNASVMTVGWRRRRVLTLGLPLWAALSPQERVALLGHEFGHFVNGDLRRGLLTSPAYSALHGLYEAARPVRDVPYTSAFVGLAQLIAYGAMWVVSRVLLIAYLGVVWIGHRATHRAEYHADEIASTVGGTTAAASMIEVLLAAESMDTAIRSAARAGVDTVAGLRAAADGVRRDRAGRQRSLQQLSVRDQASLFASHPPSGMRRWLLESRPYEAAQVVLSVADSERIDAELAPHYIQARRDLAWNY